ncbi:hypothetical protein HAX54_052268 [Datura stramonium]|uniref:Phytosulfokine n=1 Tax=Datura stramonium TaxID=4076 RepID=A0ABS8SZP5_DATST|nr:hypothetical protein [Datura stramonium]
MKQLNISCFLVILMFLFVFLSPASSSRYFLSTTNQVVKDEEVKINGKVNRLPYLYQLHQMDSLNKLMGVEECEEEEEDGECLKRRVLAEAHLDYIYTQNRNHP